MNELILIEDHGGIQTVSARDLWGRLESKQEFANWIKSRLDGFDENKDFLISLSISTGGRPSTEYYVTIDMAKHLAMLERNDQGKKIRQYFIEVEKKAREITGIPKTFSEALQLAADQAREIEEQGKALALAAPKVESFDALQKSDNSMSITQAAKHFAVNPKTMVFPYLRAHNYLTIKDLPSQSALDAGYMVMRETRCPDGTFRPQARVLDCQLETWRTKVIPQIARWIADV